MKYTFLLYCLCVCISSHIIAKQRTNVCETIYKPCDPSYNFSCNNACSRTFQFIRPIYEHVIMRNQAWTEMILTKMGDIGGAIQAIGMYQHSRPSLDSPDKFAKYWLMKGKSTLLVSGDDNTVDMGLRDVRAEWLGLPSNFRGFLTVCPEQSQAGVLLEFNYDANALSWFPGVGKSHFSIILPYVHAMHDLHLTQEYVQNPGTSFPHDIIEAFDQPNWHNAKIAGRMTRSQFPEVRFQFWRTFMDEDDCKLAYYSSLIFPTNTKPNPNYLFNATTGNGGHAAINAGLVIEMPLTEIDNSWCGRLIAFSYLDASYRFHNHQWRTFDLKYRDQGPKQWSRYMLFATENNPFEVNIPGVNVLTVPALVRAYGLIDFVAGVRWKTPWVSFEFAYNAWAHSKEHVKVDCHFRFNKGIQGTFSPGSTPQSASFSTISTLAPNDPHFVVLKISDLDIHSAATPGALTNSINVTASSEYLSQPFSIAFGIGGFAEWSTHNSPLDAWGAWAKCTMSF